MREINFTPEIQADIHVPQLSSIHNNQLNCKMLTTDNYVNYMAKDLEMFETNSVKLIKFNKLVQKQAKRVSKKWISSSG